MSLIRTASIALALGIAVAVSAPASAATMHSDNDKDVKVMKATTPHYKNPILGFLEAIFHPVDHDKDQEIVFFFNELERRRGALRGAFFMSTRPRPPRNLVIAGTLPPRAIAAYLQEWLVRPRPLAVRPDEKERRLPPALLFRPRLTCGSAWSRRRAPPP